MCVCVSVSFAHCVGVVSVLTCLLVFFLVGDEERQLAQG